MLTTYSPAEYAYFTLGLTQMYDWGIEALESIGNQQYGGLPTTVRAANGSGKTTFLIAPAISWFMERFPRGKVVITSASFNQIKNQLWPAIDRMAKGKGWKMTRGSECKFTTPSGGEILGFATNNPGRAEGWHPTYDNSIDPVFIIVDEAKSVPNAIFEAFDRCTRLFQLWVSSTGAASGEFYRSHTKDAKLFHPIKVTSLDCPHIDPAKRERDLARYGVDHPIYMSMHDSEFADGDDRMILDEKRLQQGLRSQPEIDEKGGQVWFCDFAAGGDENVIAGRTGNKARIYKTWRDVDTMRAAKEFVLFFKQRSIPAGCVYGDASGLGAPIIDKMRELGFHINRVQNQEAPIEPDRGKNDPQKYANRGSEIWFEAASQIEHGEVNIVDDGEELDPELREQLTDRLTCYNNKLQLMAESKKDMKIRGVSSPDRGDALCAVIAIKPTALTSEVVEESIVPESLFMGGGITF